MNDNPPPESPIEWWYSACCSCTAKWFAPFPQPECPRCGAISELSTRIDPPWLKTKSINGGAAGVDGCAASGTTTTSAGEQFLSVKGKYL